MKNKLIFILIVAVIIVIIGFSEFKTPDITEEKLEVGVVIPLSGPMASISEDFIRAFELAYEETDATFNYYVEDAQSSPVRGVSAANKLLSTKNVDVLVSMGTVIVMPLIDVAENYDVPLIGSAVGEDEFATNSKNTFKMYPNSSVETELIVDFAKRQGYENIGILTVKNSFGNAFNNGFEKGFDGNIVLNEEFLASETDFRLFLREAKDLDAVYFVGFEPHNATFLKQRDELGLNNLTILSTTHIRANGVKTITPPEFYENVYATTPTAVLAGESLDFQNRFKEKFNRETDWNAPAGYDTVLLLNEINSKPNEKPIDVLYDLEIEGIHGLINFDEWGQFEIPLSVINTKDDSVIFE